MRKLLLAVLLCFAGAAQAEWILWDDGGGTRLFVDLDTKKTVNGKSRIWVMYDTDTANDVGWLSIKILQEANCTQGQSRQLSWVSYKGHKGTGEVGATSDNSPGAWSYPAPGTFGETTFILLCGKNH